MTTTIKIFYSFFWKNKSCQNLFLLSKEELLENISYDLDGTKINYTLPRIIISNALQNYKDAEVLDTVVNRTESQSILLKDLVDNRINSLIKPFEVLLETKLKKPFENLVKHIEKKGLWEVFRIIALLANEKKREENVIALLKEFKFINPSINNYKELEENFKKVIIPKKGGQIITEQNITTFFEGVKMIKDIYITFYSKKLYTTNQILVNSLHSEDNFESRLKLFHLLYENEIISSSQEDALIECTNCKKGSYGGVLRLNIDPNKLQNLKCPNCNKEVTYFVPYELHKDIFEIIKEKDGLLLHAYCNFLQSKNISYQTNLNYLDDIEIDCMYNDESNTYIIESKMYKINTPINRLEKKIKKDFSNLIKVVKRLETLDEFKDKNLVPFLLVNVVDNTILIECEKTLKENHPDDLTQKGRIINFNMI